MHPFRRFIRPASLALPIVLALFAASCTSNQTAQAPPPEAASTPAALSDGQIAAIVLVANTADVATGELARTISDKPDVDAFATQMIADHTKLNQDAIDLAKRLELIAEDSDVSRKLQADAEAAREALKTNQGAAFDKAYVDHEVAHHQAVLQMLDETLIPGAKNADLKALLESARPVVAAHLEHAKQLQGRLAG